MVEENEGLTQTYIRPSDKVRLEVLAKKFKRPLVDQLSVLLDEFEKAEARKYVSE